MSLFKLLGFGSTRTADDLRPRSADAGDTETVRQIVARLDELPREQARYIAAFAYVLGRVANADDQISADETREMERIVREVGELPEAQAVLVIEMAKSQNRLFGGTENFLVTRELKEIATPEQKRHLLDCLFAVSAADDSISSPEEAQIRQIASELGFTHAQFVEARSAWNDKRDVIKGLR